VTRAVPHLPPEQLDRLAAGYRAAAAVKRRRSALVIATLAAAITLSAVVGEVDLAKFFANIHRFPNYFVSIAPALSWSHFGTDMAEWFWNFDKWLRLLLDTLLIAYLGTLLGALFGFLAGFAASANLVRRAWIRFAARRGLEFCRTVPDIVFALVFVVAFGLGPMPGVLALAIHTMGALGKLFAEVVENIDMKPVEGVTAAGGSLVQTIRFAVLPQVMANFASYALLRFEINVRSATVMGFVGAGGIGMDLMEAIRKFYYSDISAILTLVIITVMVIDLGTERVRHAFIGAEEHR
jgi:phosphonate transport system permease protein